MKISASITDFPIFSNVETFFKEFKNAGVDGIEIVLGAKTRPFMKRIIKLVQKYDLPITSVHQPSWSGVGLYFDEEFIKWAKAVGTTSIICHPLTFHSFDSQGMKNYFKRLSHWQEKHDVHILLENMPDDLAYHKLHIFSKNPMEKHLEELAKAADTYGFLLTYDVSHTEYVKPQNEKIFQDIYSKIGNIHLSSFRGSKHHLPLDMGDLDAKGFLAYLQKRKYNGLITFEVYYPRLLLMVNNYDFSAIYDSVKIFRSLTDKS